MSFLDNFKQMNWDQISMSIYSKTSSDVEQALNNDMRDLEDFKALISPAAEPYIEQMAQLSHALTTKRFGNTISLYIPLYLSNLCANSCTYCGFSMENRIQRKTLNLDEIKLESNAIKQMNFDSVLLVTGEHSNKVGMKYFREVLPTIKQQFSYLSMEVQPLSSNEYAELKALGLDAVMVYQETYNPLTYSKHHLRGKKANFEYRLETPDRIASANMDKIGIGALIGLDEWRTDCYYVAAHLDYLERTYWQTKYSISFPRLRPCEGGVQPKSIMSDRQLVQLICAYRLFNPEVELSLSTRESEKFRNSVLPLGITTMSAASKTQPGGYALEEAELEQFEISDDRTAEQVDEMIRSRGYDTVWRDWHSSYSG